MFERKNNNFGSKNYKMKENYAANDLIVANFQRISSDFAESFTPIVETTEQKYLFGKIVENNKTKYREIFTGFIANDEREYLDLPYVVNPKSYVDICPENKGSIIPKLCLIWILNEINHSKKKKLIK